MFKDLDQKVDLLAEQGSLFGKKLDHVDQQLHKCSRRLYAVRTLFTVKITY